MVPQVSYVPIRARLYPILFGVRCVGFLWHLSMLEMLVWCKRLEEGGHISQIIVPFCSSDFHKARSLEPRLFPAVGEAVHECSWGQDPWCPAWENLILNESHARADFCYTELLNLNLLRNVRQREKSLCSYCPSHVFFSKERYKSVSETLITHKYAPNEGLSHFSMSHVCEQINFAHLLPKWNWSVSETE